ncbi:ricin-type beta-trefoil lectin domain protein [Streptomyces sp. UNOC14_S4]|uniref:ricin-type beta-trefoil lectin domain protein n=1 Tax=Streptomyces sp. UNOC14_S4 TaxID=2872340 RepID=UPI001E54DEC0|nr:ricin-type beta-trefoil lectin domain protein [Streptomyces sp. UNOC14_S4]MCC3769860.1 ricin-type beta-trefoil lectin domain protein [Streptomyces sp. UNOC14_S4]
MRLTGKRRIAVAATGAVAAIAVTMQITPSAFGTEDTTGTTAATAATAAQANVGPADSGASPTDGTVFHDGAMSLDAPPVRARAAVAAAPQATPQGEGWKLADGVTKSLATGYTIKFYDQKSVDWLGRYVKASADDLRRITNLPISVNTSPVGWNYVRPQGEIVIGVAKRPCVPPADNGQTGWKVVRDGSGTPNLSCGFISWSGDGTVTSGHAYIDSEFFTADGKPAASWGGETFMRNHISHELGHTMGLTHADRSATRGDCAVGKDSGEKPVMCTANHGYQDARAGTYVQQLDVQGLRYLATGAGAAVPPQGKVTGLGGKCLDVKGGKTANGTQIQLYTCNGSATQSWIVGKDGTFRALGKCLDNARNAATDGNKIELFDCNGAASQRWSVNTRGQIVHVASGKVLDVTGGSTADSTKIQLHTPTTDKRQLWAVPK